MTELAKDVTEKRGPGRPPTLRPPEAQEEGNFVPIASSGTITVDDISDQFDPTASVNLEQQSRNPFADYPQKLIEGRFYPRDHRLDEMKKSDLLQYCIRNEYFAKEWTIRKGIPPNTKDQHEKILGVETSWDDTRIRSFIDRKETHVFPSHHLVFCNLPPTKPGVPRIFSYKSWLTKRFRAVWFDLPWPMPTVEEPYRMGDPLKCAIVDDDSIRAQMFFMRQVKTGKVIMRMASKGFPVFGLLRDDGTRSLPILRRIYTNATRGSADLRMWEREEKGLPEL